MKVVNVGNGVSDGMRVRTKGEWEGRGLWMPGVDDRSCKGWVVVGESRE